MRIAGLLLVVLPVALSAGGEDFVLRDERWGSEQQRAESRDLAIRQFLAVPTSDGGYGLTGAMSLHSNASAGRARTAVLPGGAVLFSVAANLLRHGPIAIPFSYAWEGGEARPPREAWEPYHRDDKRIEHRLLFQAREDIRNESEFFEWLDTVKDPQERR